jgi:hypothetical protein
MAAKDYQICPAMFKAYIAKVSKRDPNLMLNDRREISEQEILALIIWWLKNKCSDSGNNTQQITGNGKVIAELTLLENNE